MHACTRITCAHTRAGTSSVVSRCDGGEAKTKQRRGGEARPSTHAYMHMYINTHIRTHAHIHACAYISPHLAYIYMCVYR